jgi:hypothetical protein
MRLAHQPGQAGMSPANQRLAWAATGSLVVSVGLMVVVGLSGPSAAVPRFQSASPWPPYFSSAGLSQLTVTALAWLAVSTGGLGLAAALLAARRGWRPRPRQLIIGCLLAVTALMLMPPLSSTDMLDYAIYGRIAALGHSPYVMLPAQLTASGDPVGTFSPPAWRSMPSVYGPLATLSERVASRLAGPSIAKTIFWLKVENALAFLAVALALEYLLRSDPAARTRAHLLWSVNPLMLWAILGGGHLDGLAAAAGVLGLFCLRRLGATRGLCAGLLIGAAITLKAPFAFFLLGPAWAARRSPRTLAAAALGTVAVVVPCYLVAGRAAVTAVLSRASGIPVPYQPWQLLTRVLAIHHTMRFSDAVALCAFAILAPVLVWRLPSGSSSPAGLPFVRPVLAVSLAWLICTPQQRPWYDAMIFPLLAVMPATRLDWIVVVRAVATAAGELPGVAFYHQLHPHWLGTFVYVTTRGIVPVTLAAVAGALVWLCVTGRWTPGGRAGEAGGGALDRVRAARAASASSMTNSAIPART